MRFAAFIFALVFHTTVFGQSGLVTNTRTASVYDQIQLGIDAASPGDTLLLAPFSFSEGLVIGKSVHLVGDEQGGTILNIQEVQPLLYGIHITGSSISVQNLTVLSNASHTNYAIHSEPGCTGIALKNINVIDNPSSGIDLNGLHDEEENTIAHCVVSGSTAGFGLALSSCRGVVVSNFTSSNNGFGDIGILESAYTSQLTGQLKFSGAMNLLGPDGDGLGAIVVQADSTSLDPGVGLTYDIDMQSNLVHQLSAMSDAAGANLGFLLCSEENVAEISNQLSGLGNIEGLVARNIQSGKLEVWPGMNLSDVLSLAEDGDEIVIADPGLYDQQTVVIDKSVTILGPNAGVSATDPNRQTEARFSQGFEILAPNVTIDGIRIQSTSGTSNGIELASGATGTLIKNTVIRGSFAENGLAGSHGVLGRGQAKFDNVSLRNWSSAGLIYEGELTFDDCTVSDNRSGFTLQSEDGQVAHLKAESCTFVNAGADAFVIESADDGDTLTVINSFANLHRHVLRFDDQCALVIAGNEFINSEVQVIGLGTETRIGLCEGNIFSNPVIAIEACTDESAVNYEPCATITVGCEFEGCTQTGACNFDPQATNDDGSCEFSTCAGCQISTACNYNPTATLEADNCDFESCRGCTDEDAFNYDASATIDDGSCRFPGCTNPDADNFDPQANFDNGQCFFLGCTDDSACNYDPEATLNVGCEFASCAGCTNPRACNFSAAVTINDGSCEFQSCRGCTNPEAVNYDSSATIDDNSCRIAGCTEEGATNYNANANVNDGSCTFSGCTDIQACNFDAAAASDDGSCEFESCAGCAIQGFCNYDPTAVIHDGSLCEYLTCCGDPSATNYDPAIASYLTYGCTYGQPAAGMVFLDVCTLPFACNFNEEGPCEFDSCAGCTDSGACNYDPQATLPVNSICSYPASAEVDCDGECINDINDNGVCDESEVDGCTSLAACNYNPEATIDNGSCESISCAGCTDPDACNLDPGATLNNGSCDYESCEGCTDPEACNYDVDATIDGECTYPADAFGEPFFDCNGDCLNDADEDGLCDEQELPGCTNVNACNYNSAATENNGTCEFTSCAGCLDITACNYDQAATQDSGDCDYLSCVGCLDASGCNYDPSATVSGICTFPTQPELNCAGNCINDEDDDQICDEFEIPGCTSTSACNYSPLATDDNGSCDFESCAGCTNPGACNYVETATLNDGSCDYLSCQGCTDPEACNYALDASVDDGSCFYALDVFNDPDLSCNGECLLDSDQDGICDVDEERGCLDPAACNYDAEAEFSDGSCEFTSCAGCTDPLACNYNEAATIDNGTCSNPEQLYGSSLVDCDGICLNDNDGDGICDEDEQGGCTDETACNYDEEATEDNGSCTYAEPLLDCAGNCLEDTDQDGVCNDNEVIGCQDANACNFAPDATDPGLCVFPVDLYGVGNVDCDGECLNDADGDGICDEDEFCTGDLNDDGIRSASDVLTLLAAYGCIANCGDADITGDGIVTAADILTILSVFGTVCD